LNDVEDLKMATGDPAAEDWCNLGWTKWQPLNADLARAAAPLSPGVYRIRRAGVTERLTYIGQTGRTLRERLLALANGTHGEQSPFNDTHTAAPHLWLLSRLDGALLEFSCTPVPGDRGALRGTEDMLLWRHRVENKCSTEANPGRFFPGWSRPTNRCVKRGGVRTEGRRAARQPEGQQPLRFDVTEAALQGDGPVLSAPWWERTALSGAGKLPNDPAVYCIFDGAQSEPAPVYVGETSRLSARAASHLAARWPMRIPWIAYRAFPGAPKHVLHELESDVLGWHFWRARSAVIPVPRRAQSS
jgi:hypothetical protein